MSELTETERDVVAECTNLMETFIEHYSTGNSDAIGSLYAAPYGAAIGDQYLNWEGISAEEVGRQQADYFRSRPEHWRPAERTEVSVRPVNNVSALAQIRWISPPLPTGSVGNVFSLYLCVKTSDGWKIKFAMQPIDSGQSIVTENSSHRTWSF